MKISVLIIICIILFETVTSNVLSKTRSVESSSPTEPALFHLHRALKNVVTLSITMEEIPRYYGDESSYYNTSQKGYIIHRKWLLTKNDLFYAYHHLERALLDTANATIGSHTIPIDKVYSFKKYKDITLVKLKHSIPRNLYSPTSFGKKMPKVGQPMEFIAQRLYTTAEDRTNPMNMFKATRTESSFYLPTDELSSFKLPPKQVTNLNSTVVDDQCLELVGPVFSSFKGKLRIIGVFRERGGLKTCYSPSRRLESALFYSIVPERRIIYRIMYKNDLSGVRVMK